MKNVKGLLLSLITILAYPISTIAQTGGTSSMPARGRAVGLGAGVGVPSAEVGNPGASIGTPRPGRSSGAVGAGNANVNGQQTVPNAKSNAWQPPSGGIKSPNQAVNTSPSAAGR